MRKKYISIFCALSFLAIGTAQTNQEDIETRRENLEKLVKSHPYYKDLQNPRKMPNGKLPPDMYYKQDYLRTIDPETGEVPTGTLLEISKEIEAGVYAPGEGQEVSLLNRTPGSSESPWIERGPKSVGGRTRAILFDPNDSSGKRVFAGGVSGGLWVNNDITDASSEWTAIDDFWANTSISCIASDPNNPQIIYVGTGEVYTGDIGGNGIYKSADGGATWTHIFNPDFSYTSNGRRRGNIYITDIVVRDNGGQSEVWVGVSGYASTSLGVFQGNYESGLYKSTDEGASFTRHSDFYYSDSQTTGLEYHYHINDIELGADNSIWVSTLNDPFTSTGIGGKIFYSSDGTNFAMKYEQTTGTTDSGRVQLATSTTDPNLVYALLRTFSTLSPVVIKKTVDGGETWSTMSLPEDADTGISDNDFTRGQSFYDLVIEVDPDNDQNVYVGGIDLFKSTDGASTWTQISKWSNNNNLSALSIPLIHADQHAIVFNPQNTNQVLFGNDGGVYFADNKNSFVGSDAASARNNQYNVTQFYSAKLNPTSSTANEQIIAGAQDNGTQVLSGAPNAEGFYNGFQYTGGDGGYVFFDDQADYLINSYVYNYLYINNSNGFMYLLPESYRDTGHFINEFTVDTNMDIAYVNDSNGTYYKVTGLSTASSTSDLTVTEVSTGGTSDISALVVSPYTTSSSKMLVGTYGGTLINIENAETTTPTNTTLNTPFVGSVSSVNYGLSEQQILVTMYNYNVNNVWYSPDGGTTWQEKDGNLPDMPVRWIMMNPINQNEVLIATELGVWSTSNFLDDTPTWSTSISGLSNVRVTQLDYRTSDNTLLASTYGRGVFTNQNGFLGTNEVAQNNAIEFVAYPQPSKGTLHLKFEGVDAVDVEIFNTLGQKVFEQKDVRVDEAFTTNLSKGAYVLKAKGENGFVQTTNVLMK